MDRLKEKNELMFELGGLFTPLIKLAENPNDYDEQEKAETIARYCSEYSKLINKFQKFSVSQPGHDYFTQWYKFQQALEQVKTNAIYQNLTLAAILNEQIPKAQAAINAIPIPRDSAILEARSPFTAYCFLRDLFQANTTKEIIWIDAYLDKNIFHRYLRDLQKDVSVTIVTKQLTNATKWAEFLDISRLYAQEYGANYRLIANPSLHDRWLLIDQKRLYNLGGSAKDAGSKQYFTVARLDASETNLQVIKSHINSGTELFGASNTTHP